MDAKANLGLIRITPRKVGVVADEVRGKTVTEALNYLHFSTRKRTAQVLAKLIKSAAANATQANPSQTVDNLMIKSLTVGPGPTLKRFRPRAKGSAFRILKRTSKIYVVLTSQVVSTKKPKRTKAMAKKLAAAQETA